MVPRWNGCMAPSLVRAPSAKTTTARPTLSLASACLTAGRSGSPRRMGMAPRTPRKRAKAAEEKSPMRAMNETSMRRSAEPASGGSKFDWWFMTMTTGPVLGTLWRPKVLER